jgi:hypothetical protein
VSEGFGSSSSAQRRRAYFATEDFSSVEKLPVRSVFLPTHSGLSPSAGARHAVFNMLASELRP